MLLQYLTRQQRERLRTAVEAAIRDRRDEQTAIEARNRLSRPSDLDYLGAATKRDIPRYPNHADAIAAAYLDLLDD